MEWDELITNYINQEIELLKGIEHEDYRRVLNVFLDAYERDAIIYTCGNGGSASTASHMQNDFNKGISEHVEKKFRVQCLNDNVSTMLAVANDISYEDVFSFQIENKMKAGDVLLGISGSGNSENVIRAMEVAKAQGAITVGLVGFSGGKVAEIADVVFHAPICNMQIVEDLHLIINHLMMWCIMQKWGLKAHC